MTVVIDGTTGVDTGTGSLIAANASTPTYVRLFEDTDNGSNYVDLIAPTSVASNRTITLPDGTGTVAVNGASGVLVSGTAVTASGTSVDFTGIPSWVKRVTVMFSGVSTNGTSLVQIQLGDSGGIETTGYVSVVTTGTTSGNSTTGFIIYPVGNIAYVVSGLVTLTNITSNSWVNSTTTATSPALGNAGAAGGGNKTLSDTLTQVRITTVNGTDTFDAGTINIIYE